MFKLPHFPSNHWFFAVLVLTLGIQSTKLRMRMEPKYLSVEGDYTPLAHHLTFGDWIPRVIDVHLK